MIYVPEDRVLEHYCRFHHFALPVHSFLNVEGRENGCDDYPQR